MSDAPPPPPPPPPANVCNNGHVGLTTQQAIAEQGAAKNNKSEKPKKAKEHESPKWQAEKPKEKKREDERKHKDKSDKKKKESEKQENDSQDGDQSNPEAPEVDPIPSSEDQGEDEHSEDAEGGIPAGVPVTAQVQAGENPEDQIPVPEKFGEVRPRYDVNVILPYTMPSTFVPGSSGLSDLLSLRRKHVNSIIDFKTSRMKKVESEMKDNDKKRKTTREKTEKAITKKGAKEVDAMKKKRKKEKNPMTGDEVQAEMARIRNECAHEIDAALEALDKKLYEEGRNSHMKFLEQLKALHLKHLNEFFELEKTVLKKQQTAALNNMKKHQADERKEELKGVRETYKYEDKMRKRENNPLTREEVESAVERATAQQNVMFQQELTVVQETYAVMEKNLLAEQQNALNDFERFFAAEEQSVPTVDAVVARNARESAQRYEALKEKMRQDYLAQMELKKQKEDKR